MAIYIYIYRLYIYIHTYIYNIYMAAIPFNMYRLDTKCCHTTIFAYIHVWLPWSSTYKEHCPTLSGDLTPFSSIFTGIPPPCWRVDPRVTHGETSSLRASHTTNFLFVVKLCLTSPWRMCSPVCTRANPKKTAFTRTPILKSVSVDFKFPQVKRKVKYPNRCEQLKPRFHMHTDHLTMFPSLPKIKSLVSFAGLISYQSFFCTLSWADSVLCN